MMTARYLGPSNFGLINYATSVVAFVTPIMQLGFNSILVNEIINHPEKEGETLGTALVFNLVTAFFTSLGVICFAMVANAGETETIIVCALYSTILFAQALEMIQYWYQAKLLSKYTSIVSLIAYAIVSAYKIILLVTQMSVRWFALSNAFDYAIIAIALLIIYKKVGTKRFSFSISAGKRMWNLGKYYIVSNMMITIFSQTDKIMLKLMIDDSATGYYSAGVACASITSFIFSAIIDSFRPIIFESKKISESAFENNMCRLYSVVIWLALMQSLVVSLCSGLIINILYGTDYSPAVNVLRLIVWYTTFSYLGSIRNIWILAENKQKYLWIINLSGAIANVVLNTVLIPFIGVIGAALASLLTQIFTNVIIGYVMPPIRYNNKLMVRGFSPKFLIDIITKVRK